MSRRRWVYRDDGKGGVEVEEVGQEWEPTNADSGHKSEAEIYDGVRAPDGTDLSSRTKHARYLKENNLSMMSDFKEHHARIQDERRKAFTGGGYDTKARKLAINDAINQLQARGKRK